MLIVVNRIIANSQNKHIWCIIQSTRILAGVRDQLMVCDSDRDG